MSCFDYCNGHADFCFAIDPNKSATLFPNVSDTDVARNRFNVDETTLHEMIKGVTHGATSDAICVNCVGRTVGKTCDRCDVGHFRNGPGADSSCLPCDCNGHGNVCDEVSHETSSILLAQKC